MRLCYTCPPIYVTPPPPPPFVTVASWIGRCGTRKTLDLAVTYRVLLPHERLTKL